MSALDYLQFDEVNPRDFLPLLNSQRTRAHLIEHEQFTIESVMAWMRGKMDVDAEHGCRVRAVMCESKLAGWCGIQCEEGNYEIAIVIDEKFWGLGKQVFQEMMACAKELGHKEVFIHFLHTRPDYKFLQKIASNVFETQLFGNKFTSYQLTVK